MVRRAPFRLATIVAHVVLVTTTFVVLHRVVAEASFVVDVNPRLRPRRRRAPTGIGETTADSSSSSSDRRRYYRPALVVFDLDRTLWEPSLHELRGRAELRHAGPVAGRDVRLLPAARAVLDGLRDADTDTRYGVASRSKSGAWARDLLRQFGLTTDDDDDDDNHHEDGVVLFDDPALIRIFSGDKKTHFAQLKRNSGVEFGDMLFFDDARDGEFGNCVSVSALGVLCVHCPDGLTDEALYHHALDQYDAWKHDAAPAHTIVESDGSLSTHRPS